MSALSSNGPIRAAQYLRMSSDNQRYSTENQQNAIAEYAGQHGYNIVASYRDAGKSGLSLKGRAALKQLLSDALQAHRAFDAILVYDVSRWGRFQNPDQAAHYEFLCRQAGVRVVYCAEPFGEDVAPITTIVKHLKRVMAGEYSRELSAKLSRAKRQQAQLGFRQGGCLIYGFRRLLVDSARNPRQVLNSGERKALTSDKVVVIPGPSEELAVIRRIFSLYVRDQLSIPEIVKHLATAGIKGYRDGPLAWRTIRHILSNELCIGQITYNVTTKRLQGRTLKNPKHLWTRFSAFDPIVPVTQFRKAQERLARSASPHWDKEAITDSLHGLLAQKGRLSQVLINDAEGVPSAETVANRFGSLNAAYAAIGYDPPDRRLFGMNGKRWSNKAILTGLQKLYATQGHISNRLIDSFPDLPSKAHVQRRFGSISDAKKQAGLPVLSHSEAQRHSWTRRKAAGCNEYYQGVLWTDADLLRALSTLEKQYGYMSANLLDQSGGAPSASYFIRRFGSLAKARALAQLPARSRSQIMLAALKRKKEGKTIGRKTRQPEQRHCLRYRSDNILHGLKRLAKREGMVSARLIDEDADLPSLWFTSLVHFPRRTNWLAWSGWTESLCDLACHRENNFAIKRRAIGCTKPKYRTSADHSEFMGSRPSPARSPRRRKRS
jgi:DNA invertase Pin-like site-specific DNA recombinase